MTLTWKCSEEVTQLTYVSTQRYRSLEVIGLNIWFSERESPGVE